MCQCYIRYTMDFRFVPSDPVFFDKLSLCDELTGIWQHIWAVGYNRCVTGRRPCDENHAFRFGQSAENCSRAWNTQLIRSSLTSLQGGASVGTLWLTEENMGRSPLSEYMSSPSISQPTTNSGLFKEWNERYIFIKKKWFVRLLNCVNCGCTITKLIIVLVLLGFFI